MAIKNIVICSDGTGNSANKDRGTNVFKLFEALDLKGHLADPPQIEQIAFYDDGVGTESFKPVRIMGGAFGWGLSGHVRELYAALVRSYNPGDRIYLFGFSRGAFTARTLGGFITSCGILDGRKCKTDAALRKAVENAYNVYRSGYMTGFNRRIRRTVWRVPAHESPSAPRFKAQLARFREEHAPHEGKIEFIGVWDTVDAVGLPFDHLAGFINYFIYPFKFGDRSFSLQVKRGCHAIAIDDERHTFHPMMWNETAETRARISQVWFAGVHSNVGGGYPKQGMSLVSLDWMMDQAEKAGLKFNLPDRVYVRNHANVNGKLYNSRAGYAVFYRYKPRDIATFCSSAGTIPKIHDSVLERILLQTEGYAPGNLPISMEVVATDGAQTRQSRQVAAIATSFKETYSTLDRAPALVKLRRSSHYVFLALSVALVAVLVIPQFSVQGDWWGLIKAIFSLDRNTLIEGFKLNSWSAVMLLALVAVFFLIQLLAENSMKRRFSGFWHKLITALSGSRSVGPVQSS